MATVISLETLQEKKKALEEQMEGMKAQFQQVAGAHNLVVQMINELENPKDDEEKEEGSNVVSE